MRFSFNATVFSISQSRMLISLKHIPLTQCTSYSIVFIIVILIH